MPSWQSYLFRRVMRWSSRAVYNNMPVEQIRALGERAPAIKPPRQALVQAVTANGVPGWWVDAPAVPSDRVILYLHGGGFILGWNGFYYRLLFTLSRVSSARTLGIEYRLAPEHPFPAAVEDCVAAYRWLLEQGFAPERIVIAGDSAGGNLTLATLLALRQQGEPLPAAAVCISPATDFTASGASRKTRAALDPILSLPFTESVRRYYAGDADLRDPLLSPLFGDLHGLPPILIHVGDHEILLSDAEMFTERARAAGVDMTLHIWPHMWHVFHLFTTALPEARLAFTEIGAFVRQHMAASEMSTPAAAQKTGG